MSLGYVGVLSVDLHLPTARSLKEKRRELQRVKAAVSRRHACAVAEVDHHELWQRSRLTLALVARTGADLEERLDALSRQLHADPELQVVGELREVVVPGDAGPHGDR